MIKTYNDIEVKFNCDWKAINVVYLLTFPNGKIYIGITTKQLKDRIISHCSEREKQNNLYKYNAIRKYKYFEVDILYQGDDINDQEIYFIQEYKSNIPEYGYNIENGGYTGHNSLKKKLRQYDIDGNFIKEYDSRVEACKEIGKNINIKSSISCGYRWSYDVLDKLEPIAHSKVCRSGLKPTGRKGKPIYQYSVSGDFIRKYDSLTEAQKSINGYIHIDRKTSCGYVWSYEPLNNTNDE